MKEAPQEIHTLHKLGTVGAHLLFQHSGGGGRGGQEFRVLFSDRARPRSAKDA